MIAHRSRMWELYDYAGYRVRVVQQWHDPFGRPMLRVETMDAADSIAEGTREDRFLASARRIGPGQAFDGGAA